MSLLEDDQRSFVTVSLISNSLGYSLFCLVLVLLLQWFTSITYAITLNHFFVCLFVLMLLR